MGFFNDVFSGGADRVYDAQAQAWLRSGQEGEQRSDRQLQRIAETGDKVMDQGLTAYDKSYDALQSGIQKAEQAYAPYADTGAQETRQALSGAMGPEAQAQAYADYQESPGVAWLRERGMSGINRDAAATGGLGGGNRLKALSQFNQGLASQDFGNYWNRLVEIAGTSYSAAQNLANLGYGAGIEGSGLEERRGAFQTGLTSRTSDQYGAQQQLGDQRYLDAIMGTGEARAQKAATEGAAWQGLAGAGLSAVPAMGGPIGGAIGRVIGGYQSSLMPQRQG